MGIIQDEAGIGIQDEAGNDILDESSGVMPPPASTFEISANHNGYDGDVAIVLTPDGGQIFYVGGQPVMDVGLENAVNISLLTGLGWWANALNKNEPDKQIGSDFEERTRPKAINTAYLRGVEDAARDATRWIINQKIAQSINAVATWPGLNRVDLEILITKPGGDIIPIRYELNWEAGILYPVTAKVEGF